jgi:glycosyltransferase involved in cell wall biosynthesis
LLIDLPIFSGQASDLWQISTSQAFWHVQIPQKRRLRVAVIAAVLVRYDAISTAARNTFFMLENDPDWEVSLISANNDFNDLPARTAKGLMELLTDSAFCNADLIIYHFGIYSPFLDALLVGNGRARQVVRFHNITPRDFVDDAARPLIDRSFQQLQNLRHADLIWADSQTNADVLLAHGLHPTKIEIIPLVVDEPVPTSLRFKRASPIDVLFVGRMVQAKGVLDCIEACHLALRGGATPMRLTLAGSGTYSDARYIDRCWAAINRLYLTEAIVIRGTLDPLSLSEAYRHAQVLIIPSYHEGFCMPVIEGLRSGCVPLGYAAGNLPTITGGFGRLVPVGDVGALARALGQLTDSITPAVRAPDDPLLALDRGPTSVAEFDSATKEYVAQFSMERVANMTTASLARLLEVHSPQPQASAPLRFAPPNAG